MKKAAADPNLCCIFIDAASEDYEDWMHRLQQLEPSANHVIYLANANHLPKHAQLPKLIESSINPERRSFVVLGFPSIPDIDRTRLELFLRRKCKFALDWSE